MVTENNNINIGKNKLTEFFDYESKKKKKLRKIKQKKIF
jgi:hypothetical protein